MISKGFKTVYHLKGGILGYLKEYQYIENMWGGHCYVFDNRIAIDNDLVSYKYLLCQGCRQPLTYRDEGSFFYNKGKFCSSCYTAQYGKWDFNSYNSKYFDFID